MDILKQLLTNQLFWGFLIGFALCVLALWDNFKTKRELKRLKGLLADKLEIEAEKMTDMKNSVADLKAENENLRMKINAGRVQNEKVDLERDLEIYARAERTMMVNAPGFAPAWEKAKEKAMEEIMDEEKGKSAPKRIFKKLFNRPASINGEVIDALPEHSGVVAEQKKQANTPPSGGAS